ncbi:DUF1772 domain-containing protein [Streptomyces sp. NPDC005963]|uniref:anthrone oxygenase family protein n=1 Tax=Streptomyces sp. NPDC005963 TaxID=3156721 RepID=UPI0033D36626
MAAALLALAIISTGLYAGFMLTFQTGIMPAFAQLTDEQFLTAMRRINEVVPRPLFLATFVSIVLFPLLSLFFPVDGRTDFQRNLLITGLVCAVANHVVTVVGNIPLNNALEAAAKVTHSASDDQIRLEFEPRWNQFHLLRTMLAIAAFGLMVGSVV